MPDFISVTVPADKDNDDPLNSKRIIVEIINIPIIKPFLGGYVNKQTGRPIHPTIHPWIIMRWLLLNFVKENGANFVQID